MRLSPTPAWRRETRRILIECSMAVVTAASAHENVSCRLGVVHIGRAHLATPPWIPAFAGKSMWDWPGYCIEEWPWPLVTGEHGTLAGSDRKCKSDMSIDSHSKETDVNIALLRGINVGGKNKLPMKDLAAMFVDAGCEDVRTYIQSGNVVFRAEPALAKDIPSLIGESIMERVWLQCSGGRPHGPRVARGRARPIPSPKPNSRPTGCSSSSWRTCLNKARVESLDPDRSPGDEFAVVGREVFVHYPNGVARSKLTNAYFDSRLSTTSTGRNWRTVNKLLEMVTAAG